MRLARLPLLIVLSCLAPGTAGAAQGIALAWNNCFGEASATQNKAFACNTNVGAHLFTGSLRLDTPFSEASGQEIVIELASASPTLPAWWRFKNTGSCRLNSLGVNTIWDASSTQCIDWGEGGAIAGIGTYCLVTGPCFDAPASANLARLKIAEAVPATDRKELVANQDYFLFNVTLNNQKTVGTGSCEGCDVPVCIVLNSIKISTDPSVGPDRTLTTPLAPGSNVVTWQGGGVPNVTGRPPGCPAATPTRSATWGSVKTLYR
jgi:hypothetical protein